MKKTIALLMALVMVLCLLPSMTLAASWEPDDLIKITVRIFNPDNGVYFKIGDDTCRKGDQYIQSDPYTIPALSKFIGDNSYTVQKVAGNWYFPTGDRNVGSIVNWSCNSSTATMTYWVRGYNGASGGTGGGGNGEGDGGSSGSGNYSMTYTIVYHSNYPSGTDYTQSYQYTVYAGYNIANTGMSVDIKSPSEVGFTAPSGFKLKNTPWNKKADGTGDGANKVLYVKPNSTNHIYAQWEGEGTYYTITYKDGDTTVGTDNVLAGEPTTAMGALTKEGSTFKGWSETKNGSVKYSAGEEFTPNGNMTLYAIWEENQPERLTLTYDKNITGNPTNIPAPQSKPKDGNGEAKFPIPTDIPTLDGFTFLNWNTNNNGEGTKYERGSEITINQDTTLYAIWEENYTPNPSAPPAKPDDHDTLKSLLDKIKVTCVTNDTAHGTKEFDLIDGSYTVGDVEGNANSGYTCDVSISPDKYVEAYNAELSLVHTTDDTAKIVTLKCNDDSAWVVDRGTPVEFNVTCSDEDETFTVTYLDGFSGTYATYPNLKYGDATPVPANPYRSGYIFLGWEPSVAPTVTGDARYVAQWGYIGPQYPNPTPVQPVQPGILPPQTGDMPLWYAIVHFLGLA